MQADFKTILNSFMTINEFDISPLGNGHINDTFLVSPEREKFVLQCINSKVFPEPEKIMENLYNLSSYFKRNFPGRLFLNPVKTIDGSTFYLDEQRRFWRLFEYIPETITLEIVESREQAYEAGRAFGEFQRQFAEYDGPALHETIKDFHNTRWRYKNFEAAVQEGDSQRIASAENVIEFYREYKGIATKLLELQGEGKIPVRITHNDCKINNLLINRNTGSSVCVIDLDTVMEGLSLYDLGDLLRTITTPAAEDEEDVSKIYMREEMFKSVVKGYLSEAGDFLNETEIEHIPFSGILLTYENGIRFLTDYLMGDVYFKVHKDDHNLIRAKTQMQLVKSMLEKEEKMREYSRSVYEKDEAVR